MPFRVGDGRRPLSDRFWSRVQKSDGCWEWQGARQKQGYGSVVRGAPESQAPCSLIAQLTYGEEPEEFVLHHCDNPSCVRPDHLFLGDRAANAKDMRAKKRGYDASGERNGRAKLTEQSVAAIRALYAGGGISQKRLAQAYGVSGALISFIVTGKNWRT